MSDRIEYRRCRDADKNTLKELWTLCFPSDSLEDIDAFFERVYPLATAFGGFDGTDAVVMLYLLPAFASGVDCRIPVWYLYAGGTKPSYRSRGLYRQLMTTAQDWASDSIGHAIYLHPADESLYGLYAALGYTRSLVSMIPGCMVDSQPISLDTYFERRIDAAADDVLIWMPDTAIINAFIKADWCASIDDHGVMWLTDGERTIERLPLSLDDSNTVTTALWIPTTEDESVIARLDSGMGYSQIYGD